MFGRRRDILEAVIHIKNLRIEARKIEIECIISKVVEGKKNKENTVDTQKVGKEMEKRNQRKA